MIAAATNSSLSLDRLPFGWFDVALLVIIGFGIFRGRKNGMTKEVLPMFEWLTIVLVSGLAYEMVGQFYTNTFKLGITEAYLFGYLTLALLVFLLFAFLKNLLTPRLTGSNLFGSMEYYLGTVSGAVRFACMTFFVLAMLHAPYYTSAEIAATKAYNARWYGGDQKGYSGDYFPSVQKVQTSVFNQSLTGSLIAKYLDVLLVTTVTVNAKKTAPKTAPVIRIGN